MSGFFGDYLGLTEAEAISKAQVEDYAWRVIRQDGRSLPVSMEHNPDRINFVIDNGIVVIQ